MAELPTTILDLAGSATIVDDLHERLGSAIRTSWRVGATHLDQSAPAPGRPGPDQQLFFAPAVGAERAAAGTLFDDTDGLQERFLDWTADWLTLDRRAGIDAAVEAYRELLTSGGDPARALVVGPDATS